MSTFLERYERGEHVQVWDELLALGEAARAEPLYADAQAVARETMRRARHNVEALIARLLALGYQFGYAWWDPDDRDMLAQDPPPPVYTPPRPDVKHQLAELEAHVGLLPLSLRAWYEQVGAVNFVGMFPVPDATDPDGFTCYLQFVRSGGRDRGRQFATEDCGHDLDPLFIDSLEHILTDAIMPSRPGSGYEIDLAPDEWLKYEVSGGGPYVITVPNSAADAIVEYEWHQTTFVNYLRTCFRWGGFPGLACKTQKPEKELAVLREPLLAM